MATKAQAFRTQTERTAAHSGKKVRSAPAPKPHNLGARAERSASVAYEAPSKAGRSRKSTRKSANRSKSESALHITAIVKSTSPSTRASRTKHPRR
jgi:hypothetical protein